MAKAPTRAKAKKVRPPGQPPSQADKQTLRQRLAAAGVPAPEAAKIAPDGEPLTRQEIVRRAIAYCRSLKRAAR